jgi:hypothetical protein
LDDGRDFLAGTSETVGECVQSALLNRKLLQTTFQNTRSIGISALRGRLQQEAAMKRDCADPGADTGIIAVVGRCLPNHEQNVDNHILDIGAQRQAC